MTTNIDSMQYMNRTVAEYLPPARPRRPPASSAVVLGHRELNRRQSNAADAIGRQAPTREYSQDELAQPADDKVILVRFLEQRDLPTRRVRQLRSPHRRAWPRDAVRELRSGTCRHVQARRVRLARPKRSQWSAKAEAAVVPPSRVCRVRCALRRSFGRLHAALDAARCIACRSPRSSVALCARAAIWGEERLYIDRVSCHRVAVEEPEQADHCPSERP